MRNNTPPASPFNPSEDQNLPGYDVDEDEELIYLGDADEYIEQLEHEIEHDDEFDDDEDELENDLAGVRLQHPVIPEKDDSAATFSLHRGPVFCGSIHPTEYLAVTGGEDDLAYVWSLQTGEVVHKIENHKDTVIAAEFSYDGNYVATGDMSGEIQVFKVSQQYKRIWEYSMGDMVWMKWHVATNVLMAGSESGEVFIWRIPSGDCKVLPGNSHKSEVGVLTTDGKRLVVGYGDGTVKLWDIKNCAVIQDIAANSPQGHTESVTTITCDPDNGRFLSGSEDGKILIGGPSGPLGSLYPNAGAVETLAFCTESDLKLAACGTLEGKVSLWDVAKQAIRVECQSEDSTGVTRMLWAPDHTLLCATLDGSIRGYEGRSGQRKFVLEGHTAEVYDMSYNKEKNLLLTTSEDHTAKVFTSFP